MQVLWIVAITTTVLGLPAIFIDAGEPESYYPSFLLIFGVFFCFCLGLLHLGAYLL